MPTTRAQHVVFAILMAFAMVYGMELYNQVLINGGLTTELFLSPFADILPLMVAVIVLEQLIGGRLASYLTFRYLDPAKVPAIVIIVFRGAFTCWSMCPMMSMVATIAFKQPPLSEFIATWIQTVGTNFPMALLWQTFVAGSVVRGLSRQIYKLPPFRDKSEHQARAENAKA